MAEKIPERVEKLARAMCEALDIDPDKTFMHGADWSPYPRINRHDGPYVVPGIALDTPLWMQFVWPAHQWIFERSGGELPKLGEGAE